YGYVYTGQTFIFLHIPDDPTTIYYHVCMPNLDVEDENRLHHTAVAQVIAFVVVLGGGGTYCSHSAVVPSTLPLSLRRKALGETLVEEESIFLSI
ncbi:hypothetical protein B0T25DRAFT_444047, partial [Lasiosphaeria hispida]